MQADIQKASPRLSTATKKQLDAQGIQHEGTVESVEGMKKLEQMRANNEFSKLLDWKARKDYYQKAHEQVASLFEKDGNDS